MVCPKRYRLIGSIEVQGPMMQNRALGIVFSARKHGNCYDCVEYCLNHIKDKGIDTSLINIYEYNIEPCSQCKYECFSNSEQCPKNDDLPEIYEAFETSDIVIFGLPAYVGHVPSLFRIFQERTLGFFGYGKHTEVLRGKTYGFIGLSYGNIIEEARKLYIRYHGKMKWIHIVPNEYELYPLNTGLLDVSDVGVRLAQFSDSLIK